MPAGVSCLRISMARPVKCFAPNCTKLAEHQHHVIPRCLTGQKKSDLRGTVPLCRRHHALVTAESTWIKASRPCWESTKDGHKCLPVLLRSYANGDSIEVLSDRFGLSTATVHRVLQRSGEAVRSLSESHRRFTAAQSRKIGKQYRCGQTMSALADKYQCSIGAIRTAIIFQDIVLRPRGSQLLKFTDIQCHRIRNQYASGLTSYQLAAKYSCSHDTIAKAIRRAGGKLRQFSTQNRQKKQ